MCSPTEAARLTPRLQRRSCWRSRSPAIRVSAEVGLRSCTIPRPTATSRSTFASVLHSISTLAELKSLVKANSNALRNGPLAVAVPAEWQGLLELHHRYGRLPLARLAGPAIAAARAGVEIGREYSARCWVRFSALRGDADARRTFMTSSGALCPLPGWTLHQPELAETLTALSNDPTLVGRAGG